LEGGPPIFRQDCTCPALLEDLVAGFPYGAVTRYGPPFQALPVPSNKATGLFRVRSPLLTESRLMSVPPATEMFQFAGFASRPYQFRSRYLLGRWVAPFGDPGIADRSHLPRAFRSVPRPSSPLSAKASTRCPFLRLIPTSSSRRRRTIPPRAGARPHGTPIDRAQRERPHMKTLLRTDPVQAAFAPPRQAKLCFAWQSFALPKGQRFCAGRVRLGHMTNSLFTLQSALRPQALTAPRTVSLALLRTSRTAPPARTDPQGQRCRRWRPCHRGGGERDRTDDLLLAKQALSQLSYTPGQRAEDRDQGSDLFSDLWLLTSGAGGPGRI
jgi:hypothetical protein